MVRYNRGKGFAKERGVLCGRCKICKEYAKTAGGCGMGCGGRLAGRIYAAPRLSKNSLAPSGRGLRPQAVGERASRRHEGFGQRRGSLPPALRATSLPEGGFLTRSGPHICGPYNQTESLWLRGIWETPPCGFTQILHNIYFAVVVCFLRIHYNRKRYSENKTENGCVTPDDHF